MTMRESLDAAMGTGSSEAAIAALGARGVALVDQDTMTQAIHDVYCGITADHDHPNQKDHDQARAMIEAMKRHAALAD